MENLNTARSLRKDALGVGAVTFFVVSAAGPLLAIAGGVPVSMLVGNGPGIPASFAIAMLILVLFSVGYTRMARYVTHAGAFYAFAARGLGGLAGGAAALVALLSYGAMLIALYGLFGSVTASALRALTSWAVPWWLCSGMALLLIGILGYRQVDLSAKILGALVFGEYLIVLILDAAILRAHGDSGISVQSFSSAAFQTGSPSIGLLFCFAAFIGFEATTIYAEEARNPRRTIPLATYISVLLIGGFYTFSTWCMVNGVGTTKLVATIEALGDPTTLLFSLSDRYVGSVSTVMIRLLFVTSIFASLLAFHNAFSRYVYTLGRSRLLPLALALTHPRHQSPHRASALQTTLTALALAIGAVMGVDPVLTLFAQLSALATLGILLLMAVTSFAAIAFFRNHEDGRRDGWSTRGLPLVAGIALFGVMTLGWRHFDVLSGTSGPIVQLLPWTLVVAATCGLVLALRLRQTSREAFQSLGRS